MIVTCENCDTRFTLDETVLEKSGSKVQCSNCDHVFTVFPPSGEPAGEEEIDALLRDLAVEEEEAAPGAPLEPETQAPEGETPFDIDTLDLSEISDLPGSGAAPLDDEGIERDSGTETTPKMEEATEEDELEFVLGEDFEIEKDTTAHSPGDPGKVEFDLSDLEEILKPEKPEETDKKTKEPAESVLKEEPPKEPPIEFDIEILEDTIPDTVQEETPVEETDEEGVAPETDEEVDVIDELDLTEFKEEEPTVSADLEKEAKTPVIEKDLVSEAAEAPLESETGTPAAEETEDKQEPRPAVRDRMAEEPRAFEPEPADTHIGEVPPEAFSVSGRTNRVGKSLFILLILALLGGAGYGAYFLVYKMGVSIPYLTNLLKTESADPGNLKVRLLDVEGHFVPGLSPQEKRFVISGKVQNNYDHSRKNIQITGNILKKTEIIATKTVYCGNLIPETDLVKMDMDAIDARLSAQPAESAAHAHLPSGKAGPFMIVFGDLPPDVEEYSVEVEGSQEIK
ncbi:MAG: zinc-ribbon domain-containing protein [Deltaproteobacteria bacterium]|nr:zinc-ribbon domain-containing protein [Deltaproteobacteria bacterium]